MIHLATRATPRPQHRDDLPDARPGRQRRCARQRLPRPRAHDPPRARSTTRSMENETRKVMGRLNPNFTRFEHAGPLAVRRPAPGRRDRARRLLQRPDPDHGRADRRPRSRPRRPRSATSIRQLKDEGIGIFLISHDIHDVFDLSDRISVMYHGRIVDTVDKAEVTPDEMLEHDHPRQAARARRPRRSASRSNSSTVAARRRRRVT